MKVNNTALFSSVKCRRKMLRDYVTLQEYLPANLERRQHALERKRLDYWNLVKQYYDVERDEGFQDTYRQIHIDIPRMSPLISLFQQTTVQLIFERILYIWAIRHPASGYVQVLSVKLFLYPNYHFYYEKSRLMYIDIIVGYE
jgi:hypothetical protein